MKILLACLVVLALPIPALAQAIGRPEIMVLGTFHMNSPGRDVHSTQVDDMLSPRRQGEIAQLLEVLKRFRSTRMAIESNVGSQRATQAYAKYRAGNYALTRNEIDQIGYRLAKEMGHESIYAVDEDGDFPFMRVKNYAIANGQKDRFDAEQAKVSSRVKGENAFLATHSVLQMLELMNADSTVATAVSEYYTGIMPFGEPYEYAGPDLIASWFQRNIRIYRNTRALITSPNDRILVIYGSGHLGWLRQIVGSDATVRLRTLADVTRSP